jgi:hypothetical protein
VPGAARTEVPATDARRLEARKHPGGQLAGNKIGRPGFSSQVLLF